MVMVNTVCLGNWLSRECECTLIDRDPTLDPFCMHCTYVVSHHEINTAKKHPSRISITNIRPGYFPPRYSTHETIVHLAGFQKQLGLASDG